MSDFHGAFATGEACHQGTLTLPDTWFRPPLLDLLVLQLLRQDSSNLPCLYSTFHLEYPLVLSRFCLATRHEHASRRAEHSLTYSDVTIYTLYYLCCMCIDFNDLSTWGGCWLVIYIRMCIYKFLNITRLLWEMGRLGL